MRTFKTPKPLEQQYDAALARAARDGVRVVADFSDAWLVTSSQPGHYYRVTLTDDDLMLHSFACPCQTEHEKHLCKHIATVFAFVVGQIAEREAAVAEAKADMLAEEAAAALVLVERSERELTGVVWNQVELFWMLINSPLVAVVNGAAMSQQAKVAEKALISLEPPTALAHVIQAEQRINDGFKQRLVERIRERDKIMGRHTELGPTLKPFDYVEADPAFSMFKPNDEEARAAQGKGIRA